MEQTTAINHFFEEVSSMITGSFYIEDVQQIKICYVKPDDLFLCGFSTEDVLRLGYNFFPKVIYSDDLLLWTYMRELILRYLKECEEEQDEIDYFSCTFRLKRTYSFSSHPLPQMVFHRMKPIWMNHELRYLICSVESSTLGEAGHLCLHYKDRVAYSEYNFITRRWKRKENESLTERERAILMLAEQGKSSAEMGDLLCKGHNTIRNQIKALFSKLKIHSMQEAIEFARNLRMIYPKRGLE